MTYSDKKNLWLNSDLVSSKDKSYIESCSEENLKEMFEEDLAFGTAGLRALLGPGSSRMNIFTVKRATIGVAKFLLGKYGRETCASRGAVISFDNRHYSKEFRDIAAKVLSEHGIKVYTFNDPHPTPELSFAIRKLNALGGIMITASHNSREYNGYKFYDDQGCQGVYEQITRLMDIINDLPNEIEVSYNPVSEKDFGEISFLDENEEFDKDYIEKEVETSLFYKSFLGEKKTKIIFSPSCGCNCKVGPMLFKKAGYKFAVVPGQDQFDPDFKNMEDPNPENDAAYKGAINFLRSEQEKGEKYNLILVTDPDADRCGLAYLDSKGNISRLNGNQIGAMLLNYKLTVLKEKDELPKNGVVCTTFVTGSQGIEVCKSFGIETRIVATGFKFIGNLIEKLRFDGQKFLFGYEESYGYLLTDLVRDKDSLQAIMAIVDMTEYYLRKGLTLDLVYEKLNQKTGKFYNTQRNISLSGPTSLDKVKKGINNLRSTVVENIGPLKVKTITDYLKRTVMNVENKQGGSLDNRDIDRTDCIRYDFVGGGFAAVRPSGTEPKVKVYFEIKGKDEEEAKEIVDKVNEQIKVIAQF